VQTLLAVAVAVTLCWAGLTFRPQRARAVAWPTVDGMTFPKQVCTAEATFTLASPPQRVVLASVTVVDFATALLDSSRVVALCAQAFTASALARDPGPWAALPRHDRFTAELVLACEPDLVLCNDYNDQQTAQALRAAHVPVLVLPGPSSLAECEQTLDLLGAVLGVQDRAAALRADMRGRVQARREATAGQARRRALCFTHNPTGSWTGGTHTLHDAALDLAGLDNAAGGAGITGHAPISSEQIVALDPDIVVVDAPVDGGRGSLQFLRENRTLAQLRAVREGQVIELPAALYATGSHHVVTAAEAIAAALRGRGARR
jgi:iron complex transport system substrate-binding protein